MRLNNGRLVPRRAEREHDERPEWHQLIDESQTAEKTFEEPTLENVKKWERNKEEFDIMGIDSKQPKNERPDVSPPGLGFNDAEEEVKSIISRTKNKEEVREKSKDIEGIDDQEFEDSIDLLKSKGEIFEPNQNEFDLI